MPVDIAAIVELLKKRAKEFAYLHLLLYILEADIDVRRALEGVQRVPFLEKHSIRVEHSRELCSSRRGRSRQRSKAWPSWWSRRRVTR
jgi:hypothetical protein